MSLYGNVSTATATVGANTNAVTISSLDLTIVSPDMTINFGARDRKTGDAYLIASVTPTGTSGGSLTLAGIVPSPGFSNAPFLIDTTGYLGTDSSYAAAVSLRLLDTLNKLFSPATNLFAGARQLILDKVSSAALSRLGFSIAGRAWADIAQRAFTYTPTGGQAASIETLALRAFHDGAKPIDALLLNLSNGTGDLRKGVVVMASASTVDLGSAPAGKVYITGAATINSFGSGRNPERIVLITDGGALLVHSAALTLPGLANIVTTGGDILHAVSDADGNWRVVNYQRIDGRALLHRLILSGNSGSATIPPGTTRYITNALVGGHQSNVYVSAGRRGRFRNLRCVTPNAPGTDQYWKITLQNLFTDTVLTCTISGASSNAASDLVNAVIFGAAERWLIKVESSAGTASLSSLLYSMDFEGLD